MIRIEKFIEVIFASSVERTVTWPMIAKNVKTQDQDSKEWYASSVARRDI